MNQLTIRQAGSADAETVASILQEAADWRVSQGAPLWVAGELAPEKIRAEVAAGQFWLAEVGGESAGCVRFQAEDPLFWPDLPPGDSAFVHRLAVRRRFAGGAVSGALLAWAKGHAAALGNRWLRLDTDASAEKLCRLYERAGFRRHSERRVEPYRVVRFECELPGG